MMQPQSASSAPPTPEQQAAMAAAMQQARMLQAPQYDKKKYQTIFPQYLDSTLHPKDGRRLTQGMSVCQPTSEEILACLKELGFKDCLIDPTKSLPCAQSQPRQVPAPRGCVKVIIKSPVDEHYIKKSEFDVQSRTTMVEGLGTKGKVLSAVAEMIHKKRGGRGERIGKDHPSSAAAAAAAATSDAAKKEPSPSHKKKSKK